MFQGRGMDDEIHPLDGPDHSTTIPNITEEGANVRLLAKTQIQIERLLLTIVEEPNRPAVVLRQATSNRRADRTGTTGDEDYFIAQNRGQSGVKIGDQSGTLGMDSLLVS